MRSQIWRLPRRRPPVDDAYTAWLDAHSRCAEALAAWRKAATGARAAAHRRYLAALEREELAAAELERLNPPRVAA
jgi:anti-sigma factor RsiW